MTQDELNKAIKDGKTNAVTPDQQVTQEPIKLNELDKMIPIFDILARPKYHLITAPTFTPKSFLEQIQFYDNGTTRRLYLYVNNTWRYVALT